jgi:hypothetical protein
LKSFRAARAGGRARDKAARAASSRGESGQALVEFALVVPLLMLVLVALFDIGRGIYVYNGVSEAVREIARTDSVHACDAKPCSIGSSSQTTATVNNQKGLVPGMNDPSFACVEIDGTTVTSGCAPGDFVKVTATANFSPLMGLVGTWTLRSSSSVGIP